MYFDTFTVAALVDEWLDELVGGRVQDVIDVDAHSVGLEIYAHRARRYLYLSAESAMPRVYLLREKLRRGVTKPSQLGLLLRRLVEGGGLTHVSQPPLERVLNLHFESKAGAFTLVAEVMERRANLLLLEGDTIVECIRRVGADENRYRVSLPNHPYTPPPAQDHKLNPFTLTSAQLETAFAQAGEGRKAAQVLAATLAGVSPLLAREAVFRACGDPKQPAHALNLATLYDALQAVLEPLRQRAWQAGVVEADGRVQAFSAYPITHVDGWRATESMSAALTAFYGAPTGADAYNEIKKPVQAAIDEARTKLNAKKASLEAGLKDDSERERLQHSGELILAYQYTLKRGQTELIAQYDPEGEPLTIALDPALTPLENAQRYFDRYNRAKRAQQAVPQRIEQVQRDLDYVAQLEVDLQLAASYPEVDDVLHALYARGWYRTAKPLRRMGGARTGPLRLVKDGYVAWVGRSSQQNEQVTFKHAKPNDLWLHARGVAGAHGVIRDDGRAIPSELIERVAAVVAYYSAARSEARVIVDVTRVKHVRKIKGAGAGMVTYRNEHTVTVAPQSEEDF